MHGQDPDKRYAELAEKWLNGTITLQEEEEFAAWYNANQDSPLHIPSAFAAGEEAHKRKMLAKIRELQNKGHVVPMSKKVWPRIAAACVLIILAGSTYLWFNVSRQKILTSVEIPNTQSSKKDISPGSNKAVLTLADGKKIVLDSSANGVLSQQGNTKVIKLSVGQLAYSASTGVGQGEIIYNSIKTPRGGQYQLVLADGTKVWLNAASSLRFPTSFTGKNRNVELTGEAYFEVTKNKAMPFLVNTNGMQIEVVGTHFNVNAYDDEADIKTTLLEGSVKVSKGYNMSVLKPGQQAQLKGNGQIIIVRDSDTEEAVAWKNGNFQFENADIKTIMREISRWYDVEVEYKGDVSKHFGGTISRDVNASQLFNMLQLTGGVKFMIDGRLIVVMPK